MLVFELSVILHIKMFFQEKIRFFTILVFLKLQKVPKQEFTGKLGIY